jgi:hypothetical protein
MAGVALPPPETLHFGSHPQAAVQITRHSSFTTPGGVCSSEGDLTGYMLWPGARALCRALYGDKALVAGAVVVELGCGSAPVSAVAGLKCGAACVLASDGREDTLPLARGTWEANLAAGVGGSGARTPFGTCVFRWGGEASVESLVATARGLVPSHSPPPPLVVLASECIYPTTTESELGAFFSTLATLLSAEGGGAQHCVMSYTPRKPATTLAMLTHAARVGLQWRTWVPGVCADALGCASSVGEEAGAVVMILNVREGEVEREVFHKEVMALFPTLFQSLEREEELRRENEEELLSGSWGAPPI